MWRFGCFYLLRLTLWHGFFHTRSGFTFDNLTLHGFIRLQPVHELSSLSTSPTLQDWFSILQTRYSILRGAFYPYFLTVLLRGFSPFIILLLLTISHLDSTRLTGMESLSVVTLNANGLRLPSKRRAIYSNVRKTKADFIMIQEAHSTPNDETLWLTEWGGGGAFLHGRSYSKGVVILFNRNSQYTIDKTFKDTDGRFIILQLSRGLENN